MEIISWKEAKSQGLKHYFTGRPCIHGHISKHYVSKSRACVECKKTREKTDKYRAWNRKAGHKYYHRNKLKINAAVRRKRKQFPDEERLRGRIAAAKHRMRHRKEVNQRAREYSQRCRAALRALRELGIQY